MILLIHRFQALLEAPGRHLSTTELLLDPDQPQLHPVQYRVVEEFTGRWNEPLFTAPDATR